MRLGVKGLKIYGFKLMMYSRIDTPRLDVSLKHGSYP